MREGMPHYGHFYICQEIGGSLTWVTKPEYVQEGTERIVATVTTPWPSMPVSERQRAVEAMEESAPEMLEEPLP